MTDAATIAKLPATGEQEAPFSQAYALPRMTIKQEQRAYQAMRASSLAQLALLTENAHFLELLKEIVEATEEESKRYRQDSDSAQSAAALDLMGLIDELETMYFVNSAQGLRQRRQRLKRRLAEWSAPHHMIVAAVANATPTRKLGNAFSSHSHRNVLKRIRSSLQHYRSQRNKLTNANLRLVYRVAYRFRFLGLPHEDLVQEGSIGLMKAIERYEPQKGFLFSTYAYRVISQSIHNALEKQTHLVRKPFRQLREKAIVDKARVSLEQRLARPLRGFELAEYLPETLEYKSAHVANNVAPSADTLALYSNSADPEDHSLLDTHEQDFSTHFLKHKATLERALKRLDQRTETILRMRYGLGISKSYTLKEISETLSLSGERVRQISQKAITTLQNDLVTTEEPRG